MQVIFPDMEESSRQRERLLESLEDFRRGLADAPLLHRWSMGPLPVREWAAEKVETPLEEQEWGEGLKVDPKQSSELPSNLPSRPMSKEAEPGTETDAPMTFLISNEDVDRHGDVVLARGWRLEAYRRNPVFLWAHDYARPVIGRAQSVWKEPGQLLARMEFAPTDFAREVAALYRSGYQQGVSVGFKPLRYEERRQERTGAFLGIRFLEQELLEVSAVPVPANRDALRRSMPLASAPSPGVEEVLQALRAARE